MMLSTTYRHFRIILIGMTITICLHNAFSQISVDVYSGASFINEDFRNGQSYHVWLTSLGVSKTIYDNHKRLSIHGHLEMHYGHIMLFPQHTREYDLALNAQSELRWQFLRFAALSVSVGSGPGYISAATPFLAKGFTFSNNFGFAIRLTPFKYALSIQPQIRFRHLSNAGLMSPNTGIDNFLVMLGIEVPMSRRTFSAD